MVFWILELCLEAEIFLMVLEDLVLLDTASMYFALVYGGFLGER